MWYIVYHENHNGYYSGYKKSSDYYSPNWFEAVKYSSLGAAISRLKIRGLECSSLDKFLEFNWPHS